MPSRRSVLRGLGVGAAAGVGAVGFGGAHLGPGRAGQVATPRIGLVEPLSALSGRRGRRAVEDFLTYFGYRGADVPDSVEATTYEFDVDGTTYVVDVRDAAAQSGSIGSLATELLEQSTVLVGGDSGQRASEMAAAARDHGTTPYLAAPVAVDSITQTSGVCGRPVFRAVESHSMHGVTGAKYIASERSDVDSVYVYGTPFSFGSSIRTNYQRVLEAEGVTVAGTARVDVGFDGDWAAEFSKATEAGVDAVVGGFRAATMPNFVRAYLQGDYDFRLVGPWGGSQFASDVGEVLQAELDSLSADAIESAGVGPFTSTYHWNQYDNQVNADVVEVFRSTYGRNPEPSAAGMFATAAAIVQTVENASSDLVGELRGSAIAETPKGTGAYEFQAHNNQARSPMTVAPVVPTSNGQYWDAAVQPGSPVARFDATETTPDSGTVGCDLGAVEEPAETTTQTTPRVTVPGQETTEPSGNGTISFASGGDETTSDSAGSSGPLGPGIGLLGVASGLVAAYLTNREEDD